MLTYFCALPLAHNIVTIDTAETSNYSLFSSNAIE